MRKTLVLVILLAAFAAQGQNSVTGYATQLSSYAGEDLGNAGGKSLSRIGHGGGNYHMLIKLDLTGVTPLMPCTLYIAQSTSFLGNNYSGEEFETMISTVAGTWEVGTAKEDPEEGSVCWRYRAYHASNPVSWDASDETSVISSVAQGNAGSHINSMGFYLNTPASGLLSYAVMDEDMLLDLKSGFGGVLIDRGTLASGEMNLKYDPIVLRWDPNGTQIAVEKRSIRVLGFAAKNTPNPFTQFTTVLYNGKNLPVSIFNLNGGLVKTLNGLNGSAVWDGTNASGKAVGAGIYLYKIADGKNVIINRMSLTR